MPSLELSISRNSILYKKILSNFREYDTNECNIFFDYSVTKGIGDMIKELKIQNNEKNSFYEEIEYCTKFVHEYLKNDQGKRTNFDFCDTIEILSKVKKEGCACNCKAYARVLQDILCAKGYKAKMLFVCRLMLNLLIVMWL